MTAHRIPIHKLAPHDPLPAPGRRLVVMRRFDEDDPRRVAIDLIVPREDGIDETYRMHAAVSQVLAEARRVAAERKLETIYLIDRLAGPRERDILRHQGDHSVDMGQLDDFDLEEGEAGPDMRDLHP